VLSCEVENSKSKIEHPESANIEAIQKAKLIFFIIKPSYFIFPSYIMDIKNSIDFKK
jgi:hypothetical protein